MLTYFGNPQERSPAPIKTALPPVLFRGGNYKPNRFCFWLDAPTFVFHKIHPMEFNPSNPVVKRCLEGMDIAEKGDPTAARKLFRQAWNEATDHLEKFIAAYYIARHQESPSDRLRWYETALQNALAINDDSVHSAFAPLYAHIADCHDALANPARAEKYRVLAATIAAKPSDTGPFYHGTRANLKVGDLLTAGRLSNYHPGVVMNHVYFTAVPNGAGFAAALAKGAGRERVYIVEPTGPFENDPNVTDKKFPGNPTRSYRTKAPMKIVGELTDWVRQTPEEIQRFREKLAANKGEIVN